MTQRHTHGRKMVNFEMFNTTDRKQTSFSNHHPSSSTDLESSQKQVEADKKAIEELIRERDILNKVSVIVYSSVTHYQPSWDIL